MEKPFGTDLRSARAAQRRRCTRRSTRTQIFRIDHFLGKEAALNILAFRFANGLFEPIWNREHIDHVQIDVPETLPIGHRIGVLRAHRRLPRHGGDPPVPDPGVHGHGAADHARVQGHRRGEEQGLPLDAGRSSPPTWSGASTPATSTSRACRPHSDTETFIALRCEIDNWRWAGVPFYLRTGKRMAEGARIISIAFREPPKSMFPVGSGVGAHGPDHLTFDLADVVEAVAVVLRQAARPGHEARQAEPPVLPARDRPQQRHPRGLRAAHPRRHERRPHPVQLPPRASSGCGSSPSRCSTNPPPVRPYAPGSWGPNAIHQLIAPVRLAAAVRAAVEGHVTGLLTAGVRDG